MASIASFDVFDTVLTRVVVPPSAVFRLLGRAAARSGLVGCSPETFAQARIDAEVRAYKRRGETYPLVHIYTELAAALHLTEAQRDRLQQLELCLEAELLRPVPGAADRVQAARARGQRVIFVSDTYLPASFIQAQLRRHGLWQTGDACYVSCEHGKTKRTGALFQEVVEREAVRPALITHVGDHLRSDVRMARRCGLRSDHFEAGGANRYEQILASHGRATEGLAAAMAGASRLARLTVPALRPEHGAQRDVAAGVVAPVLVGYVLWVLRRARHHGLRRLYFVARDGQLLLAVARRLAERLPVTCSLHYLYGSRHAWNLPALASMDGEELSRSLQRPSWIWDSTDVLSVRRLLARVDVRPEELRAPLAAAGFPEPAWDRNLTREERGALRSLLQDEEVRRLVLQKAVRKQHVLVRYLAQEGLLDGAGLGVVDLTGHGSLHDALAAMLAEAGQAPPVGLFFGLLGGSTDPRHGIREAYLYDERLGTGRTGIYRDWGVIPLEMFCAADHGTVVGYEEDGGRVRPVLSEPGNPRVAAWGLEVVRHTVDAFIDHLLCDPDRVNPWADVREATAEALEAFWQAPTPREARAWGCFPWEDGQGPDTCWYPLAERYGWRHVVQSVLQARLARPHRAAWVAGSAALSAPPTRMAMQALQGAERLARAWRPTLQRLLPALPR